LSTLFRHFKRPRWCGHLGCGATAKDVTYICHVLSDSQSSTVISRRLVRVKLRESSIMGLSFDLGTPINTALFIYILFSVQRIIFPTTSKPKTIPNEFKAGYSWMPKVHPPTVLFKSYTPKTLEPFSGKDGERILLAINSIVFDVTAGRNFYGPSK
jgi:hypothetical protein